jgi:hypothetical protein
LITSARPAAALDTLRSQFTGNLHAPGDAGPTDVSTTFEDDTFRALQAVKAKYDPRDTIHANHEVKPAEEL